jgi:hypothetical protein
MACSITVFGIAAERAASTSLASKFAVVQANDLKLISKGHLASTATVDEPNPYFDSYPNSIGSDPTSERAADRLKRRKLVLNLELLLELSSITSTPSVPTQC